MKTVALFYYNTAIRTTKLRSSCIFTVIFVISSVHANQRFHQLTVHPIYGVRFFVHLRGNSLPDFNHWLDEQGIVIGCRGNGNYLDTD